MCSSPGLLSDDIFEREEAVGRSFMNRPFVERRKRRIGCAATANSTIVIPVILQSAKAYSHTVRTTMAERCRSFLDTSGGTETILRMISTDNAHRKYVPTTQSRPCSIFIGTTTGMSSLSRRSYWWWCPVGLGQCTCRQRDELDASAVLCHEVADIGP